MVPLRNKPKRSEATQRRVRRPFSVAEVEALVQAVEKLGTGRCVVCFQYTNMLISHFRRQASTLLSVSVSAGGEMSNSVPLRMQSTGLT